MKLSSRELAEVLTLGDKMPPGGVERVVAAPSDVSTVRVTSAVLVAVGGSNLDLGVERVEGVDIGVPAKYKAKVRLALCI